MVVCIVVGWVGARSFFLDTLATRVDTEQPGGQQIVDGLTDSIQWDVNAHLLAAMFYERSFDAGDLDRSIAEYRRAADLSPSNYLVWLALAGALSRSGDDDGAENAYKRAMHLAPSYAEVQWAYGNFLVRQGRDSDGFPLIAKAAADNPKFSGPAVALVLQMTNGDLDRTHQLLGSDPATLAALAKALAGTKNYDGALSNWQQIPLEMRRGEYHATGDGLVGSFIGGARFRAAAAIAADLADSDETKPAVGQVMNGGFETGVKLRNAGSFEWTIVEASEPQIGLTNAQHHNGLFSLAINFNTFRHDGWRDLAQLIPVMPGSHYRLEVWYRSTLKTDAKLKWQVDDATTNSVITTTDEMTPSSDWSLSKVSFAVPPSSDGIRIRLGREGCGGAACPVSGTIMFDDISLVQE